MENIAQIVFDKIYDALIFQEDELVKLNSHIDSMIKSIVEGHNETLGEQQLESLSDSFVNVISEAQRGGYCIGLKYACRLACKLICKRKKAQNDSNRTYDKLVDELMKLNNRIDDMIKSVIQEYNDKLDKKQLKSLRNSFLKIVSEAERGGFRIGMNHADRLISSIIKGS